ncbi:molybdopterin oxidoreductase [Haloferax mediterranei ATCC 33500]|uniref:Molybdopterin oxidoreductase n=1 Tax=Haloferax mediterranei (strain ATCC 33500 / DSM 1411 / JCM 8866 / NBRC 14739 / NCIMB 2177 / R-4) TaxID=523841 RepID=I3R6P0_HALMT|nr:NrfD/PsrC family molybdoenzyme membrane anchor subunit [Haloferax mediterranei]AFK19900.1 molybdopterin oxidoreductase [Haloferax mediterranei ATCC 33500]AHZ23279.1 molybdopterin oxidoreductase [Haloferax mediterranei ATCC 33500]ELZ99444.1 molybdopterin oxidoreductase [Haloferax mediterranei ATCC 33500]MDX5987351.1 NrfD/PsrC family molybdoenzyme membrane anchor subunit [Haloferax mediterranei ATCC 33500]QCQ73862.1 molybdopterin oxidoreductase [Haloferax mediterranei ATCC 33500]
MSRQTVSSRFAIPAFGSTGKLWLGLLSVLVVAGVAAWMYQLTTGLVATGMRNVFSWGLYIMMFVLFVGLSAGGLIISSAPKFFHSHRYEGFARLGVLVSLACITVAGLLILPDIGRPERIYQFFTSPDFRSPMVWDFAIVILYGVLNLWYLWLLTRRDLAARGSKLAFGVSDTEAGRKRDRKLMFWTAAIALPTAVALHSVTGWIFATQIGRGDWFSPLVAPVFIAKALVSGLGLLLVVSILADRFTKFSVNREELTSLGKVLGIFLAFHVVYLLAAERLPHAWADHFEFWAITSGFLVGESAYFWLWTVVGGAIPLALLSVPSLRKRVSVIFTAGLLAVFGTMFEGIRLVFTGYDVANIDAAPGISVGAGYNGVTTDIWATAGTYTPTLVEVTITLGIVALGAIIVTLGLRYIPMEQFDTQSTPDTHGVEPAHATDGGEPTTLSEGER